ncbi:MAG: DEAD/DEAH box helicase, partial [Chloroflexota bacterium]
MTFRWWSEPGKTPEAAGDTRPAARLTVDLPKRLTVPLSRLDTPGHLAPAEAVAVGVPRWIDTEWTPAAAGTRDVAVRLSTDQPSGSIDLTLRSWNDTPPLNPEEFPDRDLTADGAGGAERPQVPLWKRLAALLQPRAELLLAGQGPVEWPGALYDYQHDGVRALLSQDSLLLADDMGLGKTVMATVALRILALQRQVEAGLLIAPASLLGQWRRALRLWAPELVLSTVRGPAPERAWQWRAPAHVYLTSYETFREDFSENLHTPARRRTWDVVILDEAHRIKNRNSEISRKCKQVRRRRAWALTGTPVENSLDDLASVLEFVDPPRDGHVAPHLAARAALFDKLRTLQLRRRKADVLPQLPPKLVTPVVLPLTGAQRESYDRAERQGVVQLRERGGHVRVENVLDVIVRLKQICNFCPATAQSAKLEDLQGRITTLALEGHRALVFSQFTDDRYGVRALAARLRGHQPLLYTG